MRAWIGSVTDQPVWILVAGVPSAVAWLVVTLLLGASVAVAAIGGVAYGAVFGTLTFVFRKRRR